MWFILMIVLFVIGYIFIALEHPLKINKSATALVLGVGLWVCFVIGGEDILVNNDVLRDYVITHPGSRFIDWLVHSQLIEQLGEISQILFFLIGAMTIVEMVDTHGGFRIITDKIKTTKKVKLLWLISFVAFFMSAVLDNLTTSIVMVALLRKLIADKKDRWFYASLVIIAANSGGAWSPIGDVTTIMLWIAGKVTAVNIIEMTFISSIVSLIVPLIVLSFILKGHVERPIIKDSKQSELSIPVWQSNLFFFVGVGGLLLVPVFKTLTHLPPYMGMLGVLGIIWILSEVLNKKRLDADRKKLSITGVLEKIDIPSILFFLGILLAVAALQVCGHLSLLSHKLDAIPLAEPSKYYVINMIIGVFSSIIDNVPLVAGAMGMYSFPTDHYFWEFLAYCAGTGGSILIIGSAAGVAVMGLEKIDFIWYLKKISWIALLGYLAGAGCFILEKSVREYFGNENKQNIVNVSNAHDVEDFLVKNTFYISENQGKMVDSVAYNFLHFTDKKDGMKYFGLSLKRYQKIGEEKSYTWQNSLEQCECIVTQKDTIAMVNFCGGQMELSQSGRLYIPVDNGERVELMRK